MLEFWKTSTLHPVQNKQCLLSKPDSLSMLSSKESVTIGNLELGSEEIPVWRSKDWQSLLYKARKTLFEMGWAKAHAKDNQPATKWNQKADELTKIRKIILNPE